jgi:hypothetical protein
MAVVRGIGQLGKAATAVGENQQALGRAGVWLEW